MSKFYIDTFTSKEDKLITVPEVTVEFEVCAPADDWYQEDDRFVAIMKEAGSVLTAGTGLPCNGICDILGRFNTMEEAREAFAGAKALLIERSLVGNAQLQTRTDCYPPPEDASRHVEYSTPEILDEFTWSG